MTCLKRIIKAILQQLLDLIEPTAPILCPRHGEIILVDTTSSSQMSLFVCVQTLGELLVYSRHSFFSYSICSYCIQNVSHYCKDITTVIYWNFFFSPLGIKELLLEQAYFQDQCKLQWSLNRLLILLNPSWSHFYLLGT